MSHISYSSFMLRAIELAENSLWETAPNPAVGALLVHDGQIVAEGWHHKAGMPHAEAEVLQQAREKNIPLDECTLVVTLEPCNHQGLTPPCTQAIIQAKIPTVVVGTRDINNNASGGIEVLRQAGINVIEDVEKEKCLDLIDNFITWQTTDLPYTIIKLASSLDGRIATRTGQSHWISSEQSREDVHHMRRKVDAVLIGGRTFYDDNPLLDCRLPEISLTAEEQPLAVVVSSKLPESPNKYRLLAERPRSAIFWTTVAAAASPKAEALRKLGVRVIGLPALPAYGQMGSNWAKLDLQKGMQMLRRDCNCYHVLCEGGGRLALSLIKGYLAHELFLYISPKIIADNEAVPLFDGLSPDTVDNALQLHFISITRNEQDIIARLKVNHHKPAASTEG